MLVLRLEYYVELHIFMMLDSHYYYLCIYHIHLYLFIL